ncbi:MAG: LysR substrate-binding protein [Polaromonas sp.]|nr:LysR substrate-binding protein [Polaromonas sp.]MDB5938832.1 LysR substrate-binding protein [Polaromonas sp.]
MINFSLRQLEYLVAAAHHGGAARAAQALHVSQPSISKAISELENLWGERLFVRLHARGLEVTAAGAVRVRQARAVLRQAELLLAARAVALQGLLRVGCLSTLGPRYLPDILSRLRIAHPDIEVQLVEGDIENLTRQLERGSLDVALLYDLGLARSVRLAPVADLQPYALLPWGHALARQSRLKLAELAREPLILIGLPHSRDYFLSLFRATGVTPRIAYESPSMEMVRTLVANGLGVSLLTTRPVRNISYDGKRIACRDLHGTLQPQSVVLAYPADDDQQPALTQAFAQTVNACFSKGNASLTALPS